MKISPFEEPGERDFISFSWNPAREPSVIWMNSLSPCPRGGFHQGHYLHPQEALQREIPSKMGRLSHRSYGGERMEPPIRRWYPTLFPQRSDPQDWKLSGWYILPWVLVRKDTERFHSTLIYRTSEEVYSKRSDIETQSVIRLRGTKLKINLFLSR